jgi:hypothetical protein
MLYSLDDFMICFWYFAGGIDVHKNLRRCRAVSGSVKITAQFGGSVASDIPSAASASFLLADPRPASKL